ncbi:MAG: 4'-phosphopantetheinyl transferase superfamily protein [Proteobacteria bacterium]|nr:4'-phosphopantetheinyl transferase superfamily protein [Pseudomonadota bacterium]
MTSRSIPVIEWRRPPEIISPQKGQLDIWLLALDTMPCEPDCLDTPETARFNNFKYESGRQQYCISHTASRKLLGRYLDCLPREVPLSIASGGKPYLDGHPLSLFFNLSHAGNTALLAVRTEHEVGIDIEIIRNMPNTNGIAQRVFQEDEIKQLALAGGAMQTFYSLWTKMEARQKCLGRGVFGEPVGENRVETRSIELKEDLCAAVAWPAGAEPEIFNFYRA